MEGSSLIIWDCNRETSHLCQETAGDLLNNSRYSTRTSDISQPMQSQDKGKEALEKVADISAGKNPEFPWLGVGSHLAEKLSTRRALCTCSLTACTWQGHSPLNLVRAAVQEGIASKHTMKPTDKLYSCVNVC